MTTIAFKDGILACDSQSTRRNIATGGDVRKSFIIDASRFEIQNDGEGGDLSTQDQRKIRNLGGWLFTGAGRATEIRSLARWLNAQTGKFQADEPSSYEDSPSFLEMTGLLIPPYADTPIVVFEGEEVFVETFDDDHFAIGSGSDVALGAMDAGRTAFEAVAIAANRDVFTNFPIQGWEIQDDAWVALEPITSIEIEE